MPSGKVKWFDTDKGFGFIDGDDGQEAFLHASAVSSGAEQLKPGTKVEYSIVAGRRGPQAMQVEIIAPMPSVAKTRRRKAEEMVPVVEDLIKLLDASSSALRRGHYPDSSPKIAAVLRAVANDFDV